MPVIPMYWIPSVLSERQVKGWRNTAQLMRSRYVRNRLGLTAELRAENIIVMFGVIITFLTEVRFEELPAPPVTVRNFRWNRQSVSANEFNFGLAHTA